MYIKKAIINDGSFVALDRIITFIMIQGHDDPCLVNCSFRLEDALVVTSYVLSIDQLGNED